jgi:hypothetical protein
MEWRIHFLVLKQSHFQVLRLVETFPGKGITNDVDWASTLMNSASG